MKSELETKLRKCLAGAHKVVAYLATVDSDRGYAPEVRTISLMEQEWKFFIATSQNSRKANELIKHPKAAALVHLRDENYSGYLRITGTVKPIQDQDVRKNIAEFTGYPINKLFSGYDDPSLYFARIIPDRVEFMAPGEDVASDVTNEFPL